MKRRLLVALVLATSLVSAREPKVRSEMLVTTEWLAKNLKAQNVTVLHVGRERDGYDAGHIPGARFLPMSAIVSDGSGVLNELRPVADLKVAFEAVGVGDGTRVVLYGDSQGLFAARAFFTLDYLGHNKTALLDGGLEKWKAEKREVSTATAENASGLKLTPKVRKELVVMLAQMRDLSRETATARPARVALLDARPLKDFTGEIAGEDVPRAGHIPGSKSIYWMDMLVSRENPVLKPESELRKMFAVAGAQPGGRVVTYCRTGVQASVSYFVAKYLGYDAAMYDGSFLEWSKAEGTAVEK